MLCVLQFCWTEKQRHACRFQVISTSLSYVILQSTDTKHTFMGTLRRILPAICTWFIVLCFVILYAVSSKDFYIQVLINLSTSHSSTVGLNVSSTQGPARLFVPFRARGDTEISPVRSGVCLHSHISDSRLRGLGSSGTVAWLCSVSEMLSVWVPSGPTLPPFPSSVSSLFSSAISFS